MKLIKPLTILAALALVATANANSPAKKASDSEAHIFFTSSTHGYFDPCG